MGENGDMSQEVKPPDDGEEAEPDMVIRMRNVDRLFSGKVGTQGRLSAGPQFYGDHVEYVVKVGAAIEEPEENPEVVEFVDPDEYSHNNVQKNGHLILGQEYEGKYVAIAVRRVDKETPTEVDNKEATVV